MIATDRLPVHLDFEVEVRRTVVIKLDGDDNDAALLHETADEFLDAANYVVRDAWQEEKIPTAKQELHDRTYSDVREQTQLQANLVQAAQQGRRSGKDVCVLARWKQGKRASQPQFTRIDTRVRAPWRSRV